VRSRARRNQTPLGGVITRHPRETVGIMMAAMATLAICVNALFLQHGPHPAPIFTTRPAANRQAPRIIPESRLAPRLTPIPAPAPRTQAQVTGDIQRELSRRGFYGGAVDGIWGAKTDAAARDFIHATGMKINAEASGALLHVIVNSNAKAQSGRVILSEPARSDPIAALIAPTKQVLAIQRALADFGYGQIKPTGVYDAQTQGAIEKFERDRRLPVTGQISDRLVRELAAMTGRPLE
jgi:peptidoglycan hydrolase-like protein with peptidoglycan-binding domain